MPVGTVGSALVSKFISMSMALKIYDHFYSISTVSFFLFFFLIYGPFLKSLLNLLQDRFCFMF